MDIEGSPRTVIAIPINLFNVSEVGGCTGKPLTTSRLEKRRSGRL